LEYNIIVLAFTVSSLLVK